MTQIGWLVALLCSGLIGTSAVEVYMKRSEVEDQVSSGSGYAYQVHSGQPLTYTQYTEGAPGNLNQFGYPPITLGRYTQQLPLQQLQLNGGGGNGLFEQQQPLNAYGAYAPGQINPAAYALNPLPLELAKYSQPVQAPFVAPIAAQVAAPIAAPQPIVLAEPLIGGGGGEEIKENSFAKGGGSSYDSALQNAQGSKGQEGYKSQHGFDKGAKGEHAKEGHKQHYSKEGASKAGQHESGGHYSQQQAAAKGVQGGEFSEKKGHKKGSSTKGYHKVHHMDEYKKDHSFYDESDSSGHFNKYGDSDASYAQAKGGFQKGANQDSGYNAAEAGAKGFQDKGKYLDEDKGFKGAQGQEGYYKNFQEYKKDKEQQEAAEKGYSEEKNLKGESFL